jgi:preprotein translocase subunit YajC
VTAIAYAMGQGGGNAAAGGAAGGFASFIPLILMFVIFYFLLIRPQQKKSREHRDMIANLKKGDRIVTGGGIHGRVTGVTDQTLTVEIADKVRVKLNRGSVATVLGSGPAPAPAPAPVEKDKGESKETKTEE